MTGYYRRFVKHYGLLAKPLTNLLKCKQFVWTSAAQQAFVKLKEAMVTTPVLGLPDFNTPFIVETDACDDGIGAVLIQHGQPLAFLSKALGPAHKHLSIYEKEFLALIMAVERWRPYLQQQEFLIRTDHKSLAYLTEQNLHSDMQRKAMTRLMGLQFKVVYRQGKDNVVADALSRVGHLMAIQAVSMAQPVWLQEVSNSYRTDSMAQQLLTQLAIHSPDSSGYSLHNGLIRFKGKLWIGNNSALQTKIIAAFHASPIGGHSGITATYHRVKGLFYWKGLKQAVESFVQQCEICQHAKHTNEHPAGLLQPLPIPGGAWQDWSMDFVEGLPVVEGYSAILVVVDRLTKYAHFLPLKHPYTAQSVDKLLLDQVIRLHGFPTTIVSDRDKIFLSSFWRELFKLHGTQLLMSTAYHPQTDGQTERVNQCLEMFLRCAVYDQPKQWKTWLPLAELWYNSSYHSAIGCSPFKALYGHEPAMPTVPPEASDASPQVAELITNRADHLLMLKEHLAKAQHRMKTYADRNRVERQYQVGEQVLLKLQPYAQTSVANRPFPKLAFKYFGPYAVTEKIGTVAYRLALPVDSKIHDVFHVSQLKPFTANYSLIYSDVTKIVHLDTGTLQPEKILEGRLVKKGNAAIPQVRVKWSHLPVDSATWEDFHVLRQRFPASPACGQAAPLAGGSVIARCGGHGGRDA